MTAVTFHPSYSYEDFVEGFRPAATPGEGLRLSLQDGIFKRVCTHAAERPEQTFVVLIDEINRGNLPRIFGELITVLESDKRNTSVVLAQSRQSLSVPSNVYIVGTMNTADRSIKMLDAAIRRRFAFHELMPEPGLLAGQRFGDLALDAFLEHLNQKIIAKFGREKQIGHSYFLVDDEPVQDPQEFANRVRYEVIPLLQEYCYEDYRTLAELLGTEIVDRDAQRVRSEVVDLPESLVAALDNLMNKPQGV
ncbi:MAG: McrB family protein [Vicinamibacterales bacterium]